MAPLDYALTDTQTLFFRHTQQRLTFTAATEPAESQPRPYINGMHIRSSGGVTLAWLFEGRLPTALALSCTED